MSTAQLISVDADEWARARRCPYTIQTALEHLVCTSENLTTHVCSEEVGGRQCGLLLGLHRRDKLDLSSKPAPSVQAVLFLILSLSLFLC